MAELLERERELAELGAALDQAVAGRGGTLAIEASAGLGKTRMLREAREMALSRQAAVLAARATDLEREFPFALVRQLFAEPVAGMSAGELESVLEGAGAARGALGLKGEDSDADPFAVLHGLYWVTAALAEREPLLLSIDDAHLADEASLDFLIFLLPRLEELRVLLLIAARSEVPDASEQLKRLLTDTGVRNLSLTPLSEEATATLLAQELATPPEPAFADTCHEVSRGNPFLLCELARTLKVQEIPPTAEQADVVRNLAPDRVIRTALMRLAQLSPQARKVAQSVAILGEDTDIRLVAELAGIEVGVARSASDELRSSVILDGYASPQFVHPLVRNAIYSDIPAGERADAHARAAQLLRDRHGSPERIAAQLLAGEPRGEPATVEILVGAAERAVSTGAPRSAIAYLNRALKEPPSPDLLPAVLEPLLTAAFRAADHSVLPSIETDVRSELARDRELCVRWADQLTMLMAMSGRLEEAGSLLKEALEVATAENDVERAFQLEAQLGNLAQMVPSLPRVNLSRYLEQIDPESPAGRLAAAAEVRAAMADPGFPVRKGVEAAKRALGNNGVIFTEESDPIAGVLSVTMLVVADELDAAHAAAQRALEIARERNGTPDLARAWYLSGFVAWGKGDVLRAEADMRQALDLAKMAGIIPLVVLNTPPLVEVLIERDELDAAEAALQAIGANSGPLPPNPVFHLQLVMRCHLRFEQGRLDEGLNDFSILIQQAKEMGITPAGPAGAAPFAVRALVSLSRRAEARALADEQMEWAESWGVTSSEAHVLRAVGMAQGGEEGIGVLQRAAAMLENSPRRLERAHALADLGEALRRANRRVEARQPLRDAFRLARRCGATRIAKRALAELEASGETVRRYTPIGVESLTPSERRVAELAASGLTNRQIAQSLFVTVKTVEAHLSAAYDKLDIGSRRQLAQALAESP